MKKFILPALLVFAPLFLLVVSPSKLNAQAETDCRKIFDRELYKCLTDANVCRDACQKETKKPDGTTYFNSGDIYSKCTKERDCDGKDSACGDQAQANFRACGKSDQQPQEAKKETPKQDGIRAFVGTHELYDAARNTYINLSDFYGLVYGWTIDKITGEQIYNEPQDILNLNRTPLITRLDEQKAWEEFLPIYTPGKENITVVAGEGEIKSPVSPQFIPIEPKGGDTVQVTYLDSTMKATSDAVQLRYTWSADSGAVINVPKWSEIKFKEPVEVKGFTSHTVELGQGEIEVKVRNNKPVENQFGVDAGWLGVTASRTHFWVSQSEDKKVVVIGIYEGEVEVKTRDGKTVKVVPENGEPGVVVVSRKLSPVKLVLTGLVVAAAIGCALMILRRKFSLKGLNKKRK